MNILLAAALIPAIALMVYVYRKDRIESEPAGLVMRVFLLGAASGIVASIVESFLFGVFEAVIPAGMLLIFIEYFIGVAAVEEGCKYFCLNTIRKNPEFNYVFDAVVYSVAAALGFAALENVFYVFDGGLEVAVTRAIFSVPGHMADGVVMGVFFGLARQRELHGNASGAAAYYWLAYLLPVVEHGFYDSALSLENDLFALLAMVTDLAFIALAFVLVHNVSKNDSPLHPSMAANQAPPWPQQTQQQPQQQQWQPYDAQRQQPQQQPWGQQGQQPSQQPWGQYNAQQQPWQQQAAQQPSQQPWQQQGQQLAQDWNQQQQMPPQNGQYPVQQPPAGAPEPPARHVNGPSVRYSSQTRE